MKHQSVDKKINNQCYCMKALSNDSVVMVTTINITHVCVYVRCYQGINAIS